MRNFDNVFHHYKHSTSTPTSKKLHYIEISISIAVCRANQCYFRLLRYGRTATRPRKEGISQIGRLLSPQRDDENKNENNDDEFKFRYLY
jgi:hypothetical protein